MEELPITLQEANVLILGYGRLGKVLANRFAALGARVAVAARKCSDLAWAEAFGYESVPMGELAGRLCRSDLVINTAPVRLLGEEELEDLRPGSLVIDLASKPGGAGVGFMIKGLHLAARSDTIGGTERRGSYAARPGCPQRF
jgi:dipicolinate synthase subunit A